MAGFGHPNAVSPKELAAMHPALVGAGERAAAGLPPVRPANANTLTATAVQPASVAAPDQNLLLGTAAQPTNQPGAGINMLFGSAVQPPPPPGPMAMPEAAAPPPPPSVIPGQEQATAIAKAVGADQMTPSDRSAQFDRLDYMRNAIGNLLQQPQVAHDHVLDSIATAVKDGVIPANEAGSLLSGLTSDPAKLRDDLANRHKSTIAAMVHFADPKRMAGST